MNQTLDLNQAAKFLGINKETLRQRTAAGTIPGAKIGKCWRFLQEDLVTYMRSLYAHSTSQGVNNQRSKIQWHSINVTELGGLTSTTKAGEYEKALGLL